MSFAWKILVLDPALAFNFLPSSQPDGQWFLIEQVTLKVQERCRFNASSEQIARMKSGGVEREVEEVGLTLCMHKIEGSRGKSHSYLPDFILNCEEFLFGTQFCPSKQSSCVKTL